jgi:hypothetical protein
MRLPEVYGRPAWSGIGIPGVFSKGIGLLALLLTLARAAWSSPPPPILDWLQQAGGNRYDRVLAGTVDQDGNLLLTGSFQTSASFGSTNLSGGSQERTAFLYKSAPEGNGIWACTVLADPGSYYLCSSEGTAIAVDTTGNIYLGGQLRTPFTVTNEQTGAISTNYPYCTFLAKFAGSGQMLWCQTNGGPQAWMKITSLALDGAGNIYFAGAFSSPVVTIGPTNLALGNSDCQDSYLAKYSPLGDFCWVKQGSGGFFSYADRLAALADGTVLLAARLGASSQFGGYTNVVSSNLFVRVSANGDLASVKAVSIAADGGLCLDANENIYTLALRAPLKVTVAKYDPSGGLVWSKDITNTGPNSYQISANGVAVDASGHVWVGIAYDGGGISFGNTNLTSVDSENAFLARYDSAGTCEWVGQMTDEEGARGTAVVADKTGHLYWAGMFNTGIAYFGGLALTNYSQWPDTYQADIFVAGFQLVLPKLEIARTGSGANVSWPSWADGFQLEQGNSPTGGDWVALSATPTNDGSRCCLAVPMTNTSSFFRLKYR